MIQWSRAVGRNNFFSAGFDWRRRRRRQPRGRLHRGPGVPIVPPTAAGDVLAGRRNRAARSDSAALFLQDVFSMNNVVVTLSARVDSWKNYDGHNFETSAATGLPTRGQSRRRWPDKDDTVVSPRVAALYTLSERVSVWGDIGYGLPRADAQ